MKKLFIIIIILILGIAGYFFFTQEKVDEDTPPSIDIDTSQLQGFLKVDNDSYFSLTEEDIQRVNDILDNESYDIVITEHNAGITYFYPSFSGLISLKDYANTIIADNDTRFIIAYYDHELKKFQVYPNGGAENETISEEDFENDSIPNHWGFIIIASDKYSTVIATEKKFKNVIGARIHSADTQPLSYPEFYWFKPESNFQNMGWRLLAFKDNDLLNRQLSALNKNNKIESFWIQNSQENFIPGDINEPKLNNNYHFVWIKMNSNFVDYNKYIIDKYSDLKELSDKINNLRKDIIEPEDGKKLCTEEYFDLFEEMDTRIYTGESDEAPFTRADIEIIGYFLDESYLNGTEETERFLRTITADHHPIHHAVTLGCKDFVEIYATNKNINQFTWFQSDTPLSIAKINNDQEMIDLLIELGAKEKEVLRNELKVSLNP